MTSDSLTIYIRSQNLDAAEAIFVRIEDGLSLKLEIYDVHAKVVYFSWKFNSSTIHIKTLELATGLYFVQLTNDEASVIRKLIVN
ncbi:T9SS type A sorting domain-containing protein [Winogradskyella sp. UBA3174]|uniref:T9SS type A sorting domain-containing protein n=1 Tax=Winogradskyella sp. UBA3174 TaxID=1947785 RepID=UPI0025CFD71A|nr:T9SS type A sorting domain-containing protein [Winogradskyella sp. UBA3174]